MGLFSSLGGILGGVVGSIIPGVGTAIGATVGSALGGAGGAAIDANRADKKAQGYYNQQMNFAQWQAQFQQDYAKQVTQWRVEDAKKAGVHPMAALGISNPSYSPVSAPSAPQIYDAGQFDTGSTFGQSLNRAAFQNKTQEQQVQAVRLTTDQMALQNEGLQLDNQFKALQVSQLASEIQRNAVSSVPSPKVNNQEPYGLPSDSTFTAGTIPLLGAARLGNSLFLHYNPEIADAVSEDMARSVAATIATSAQLDRVLPELAHKFSKREIQALRKGDAELKVINPYQVQFLWKPHMMPRYDGNRQTVKGKLIF